MLRKILGGRYSLEEKRGGGGTAFVYRGRDALLNRTVAVKVLNSSFISDDDFVARFKREAQAAASMSHPNIVSIYDVGQDNDAYYIVMEYVEGETLKDYITRSDKLSEAQAIDIAMQIGEALKHAHKHGVIHRDIKPQNILITRDNHVKVTDFGIARAATGCTLTESDSLMGSVHYMSPEQARGGFTNERSDIYSLGVVMYEMLTGLAPFAGENMLSVALKHLQEKPRPLTELNPRVSSSMVALVEKAMSKEQAGRHHSAEELLRDLAALSVPHDKWPPSVVPRPGNAGVDKNKAAEDTGEARSRRMRDMSKETKKKRPPVMLILTILMVMAMIGGAVGLIYIFFPSPEVEVPSIIGRTLAEAESILREADLTYTIRDGEYSTEVPAGVVLRQSPDPGRVVRAGREIEIIPSKGADLQEVPSVIGLTVIEARILLSNHGFILGDHDTEHSDTVEPGVIVAQNPRPPVKLDRGTAVDIVVSLGSPIVYVNPPTLVGLSQSEAEDLLSQQGLVRGQITWEYSHHPFGIVLRQGLSPFERVPTGTSVPIVLSRGILVERVVVISLVDIAANSRIEVIAEDREGRKVFFDQVVNPSYNDLRVDVSAVEPYRLMVMINGRIERDEVVRLD